MDASRLNRAALAAAALGLAVGLVAWWPMLAGAEPAGPGAELLSKAPALARSGESGALSRTLLEPVWGDDGTRPAVWRPAATLLMALEGMAGGGAAHGRFQVVLLLAAALLLGRIGRSLAGAGGEAAGLLFVAHASLADAVGDPAARAGMLALVCALGAVLAWRRGADLAALGLIALAGLSFEGALLLPLVVACAGREDEETASTSWLPLAAAALVPLVLRGLVLGSFWPAASVAEAGSDVFAGMGLLERLGASGVLAWRIVPLSGGLWTLGGPAWAGGLTLLAVAAAFRVLPRERLAWTLVLAGALGAALYPGGREVASALGLMPVAGLCLVLGSELARRRASVAPLAGVAVAVVLALVGHGRAVLWTDARGLWEETEFECSDKAEGWLQYGALLASQGEGARAQAHAIRATELEPGHSRAHLLLGTLRLQNAQTDSAVEEGLASLRTALELELARFDGVAPHEQEIVFKVRQVEGRARRQPEKTLAWLDGLAANHAGYDSPWLHRTRGELLAALGRREDAEGAFRAAVERSGSSLPTRIALAKFYDATGRPAEALEALGEDPGSLDPGLGDVRALRGRVYHRMGRLDDALNEAQGALLVSATGGPGRRFEALLLKGQILVDMGNALFDSEAAGQGAQVRLRFAEAEEALFEANGIGRTQPEDLDWTLVREANVLLGSLLFAQGRWLESHEVFSQLAAIPREGDNGDLQLMLAQCLMELGRVEEAAETFRQAAQNLPGDHRPVLGEGDLLVRSGDAAGAWAIAQRLAVHDRSSEPEVLMFRARAAALSGRLEEAVGALETVLAVLPDMVGVRGMLGTILFDLGRNAEARPHLEAAVQAGFPDAQYHAALADLDLLEGRVAEGLMRARRAVALMPDNAQARFVLARCLHADGQTREALMELDTVERDAATAGEAALVEMAQRSRGEWTAGG